MAACRSRAVRLTVAAVSVAGLVGFAPDGVGAGAPAAQEDGVTQRVTTARAPANDSPLQRPAISAHGRFVVFSSFSGLLVPRDTNDMRDVFVRDVVAGVTRLVSVGPGGAQGNGWSGSPAISARGRYVALASSASNLVRGDTNNRNDVFVRDRADRVTRRVSVGPGGAQGNGGSWTPSISARGRYVAFHSRASNLVPGDTNNEVDVFVRDRVARVTRRVSVGSGGAQGNGDSNFAEISADGRYVVFDSEASNLVPGDTNSRGDVFVRDRVAQVTRRVSVGRRGTEGNAWSGLASISAHGRYVVFESAASNLAARDTDHAHDVFVRDRMAGVTRLVSVGLRGRPANLGSFLFGTAISAGGRYVAFESRASNLVAGDTNRAGDVFVRDRAARVTRLASVGFRGGPANLGSRLPSISADGRHVAFNSFASNLVAGDNNNWEDVFARHLFN
jgi:Tol biopolymer transport system component